MEQACSRVLYDDWIAVLKDYNFAVGVDSGLPGIRGLVLSHNPKAVLFPQANQGMIILRERLSPFQIDISTTVPEDLTKYHFILHNCGYRSRPVLRCQGRPKVFVYCHDHHGSGAEVQACYQDNLDEAPDAVLTPYPSIWRRYYKIHPRTEVVFVPHQSSSFFARPVVDFRAKSLDLLVIGVLGTWAYPERTELAVAVENEIHSQPSQGWVLHRGGQYTANPNLGYSRPDGKLLLNAWDAFLAQFRIVAFGQDRWGYLVSKYSEILANCSLMICPKIGDLDLLGLQSGVHYVPLERPVATQFVPQVKRILKDFEPIYSTIARTGYEWYRNHMDRILFDKYREDITRLVGGS